MRISHSLAWTAALGGVAVVGLGAFAVATTHKTAPLALQPAPALSVTTAFPHRVSWPAMLEASGGIAAWQEAVIGAQVAGLQLIEVRANVGDPVKRGQLLARFDSDTLHADEAQLKAGLQQAEAAAAQAEANLNRALRLKASGGISEQDILQNQTQAATTRAQVASAQAQLASKELQLRYANVLAPDDGVISARSATLGAVAPIGQELFRLIRQNRLEWRGELTAQQLASIAPGQTIRLSLPDGSEATAHVREMAPALDTQSRLGMVYADIDSGSRARAGMYANGHVLLTQSSALVVPASSVVIRDGHSYVLKLQADLLPAAGQPKVTLQAVTVGRRMGAEAEITEGLGESERVVVRGAGFLNDGDVVRVVDAATDRGAS